MKKKIFNNSLPFFVAEISANHNGSLAYAKKLVKLAKIAGADAVKLQTYTPSSMTLNSKKKYFKINEKKWGEKFLWDLYQKAMTPISWHKSIFQYAKKIDIICFSTPFDEESVDILEKLKCPIYKISSFESNHFPLLKKLAKTKKPLIMSTGTSTLAQIKKSVNFLKKNRSGKIYLLYCVSNYPSTIYDFNLNNIKILKKKFNLTVGFSDHSTDDIISYLAVEKGAEIIEKHITNDVNTIDAKFSKDTSELKKFISNLKKIKLLKKSFLYTLPKNNEGFKYRRSIFVTQNLKSGDILSAKNIKIIRPNSGIDASQYYSLIGKKVSKKIEQNCPLLKKHLK